MSRPRILLVTRNFPPLTGGMERLMRHTASSLADRFDLTLIGPKGSSRHAPDGANVIECPARPLLFLVTALMRGTLHCLSGRYEYVLSGNGLTAPLSAFLARLSGATSVVFVHGLDLLARRLLYQRLFVPLVTKNDIVIANSNSTRDIAIQKGCEESALRLLHPGTTLPPMMDDATRAHERTGVSTGPLILFVGRITARKGLSAFISRAWPKILETAPRARLVVIGDSPTRAVEGDDQELARVRAAAANLVTAESIQFLGTVDDDELHRYYSIADVLIFPLIPVNDDIEGFGMVAIEAAARGTPTAAFAVGGVVDAVADGVSGRLVPSGDYDALVAAVIDLATADETRRKECRQHAANFSWSQHKKRLLDILSIGQGTG